MLWNHLQIKGAFAFENTPFSANRKYPIICAVTNEWIVEFTDEFEQYLKEIEEETK